MKQVRVAKDRWNFELDNTGQFITPIGGNILTPQHPGNGTLFSAFDEKDCDFRFGRMAEYGLNCLRQPVGVNEAFDPTTGTLRPEGLKNWDTFIRLAEKHNIYLMVVGGYPGGADWFDLAKLADNGKSLDESCRFWELFCAHFKGHPAIWAWDLRNELLYTDKAHGSAAGGSKDAITAMLKSGWPAWLQASYSSLEIMNHAYGSTYSSFEDVPGSIMFEEAPFDERAFDFRNYLNSRGYEWCRRQVEVIRSVCPGTMVCSGNNTWITPNSDLFLANGFHNRALHDLFDFITFHPYPAWECMPGGTGDPLDSPANLNAWVNNCIAMARFEHYGKPIVLQEFGWYGGGATKFLCPLPYRSEQEQADYIRAFTSAMSSHVNGFLNWPTFNQADASDLSDLTGIFNADGKAKAVSEVYRDLAAREIGREHKRPAADLLMQFSLKGIYTCRAYQDDFWLKVQAVIAKGQLPDIRFV